MRVRLRQEAEQIAGVLERGRLVGRGQMRDAGLRRVGDRAAELLEGHLFAGDGLHDVRPGDEHVRRPFDHQHEVGHRRRVDGAAGAGAHHEGDLRDHARALHVAPEDLRVAGQRDDALLDAGAARVVDPDQRAAVLGRHVHHLADLLGEHLAQRAAEHREVLAEHEHAPSEDRPVAGDDGVAVGPALEHPEVRLAMADEAVELDERPGIAELLGALAREQLALGAMLLDRLRRPGVPRLVAQLGQPLQLLRGGLVPSLLRLRHRAQRIARRRVESSHGADRPRHRVALRRARRAGRVRLPALRPSDGRRGGAGARSARRRRRVALRVRNVGRHGVPLRVLPPGHDGRTRRRAPTSAQA